MQAPGFLQNIRGVYQYMFFKKKKIIKDKVELSVIPTHIAIIPDGNRRWAKAKGLPASAGHKEGSDTFKKILKHAGDLGVKYISFYAFSSENWKRTESEVNTLMDLFMYFMVNLDSVLGSDKTKLKINVVGRRDNLQQKLLKEIERVEKETAQNTEIVLNIMINYGGRDEILDGIKKIARDVRDGILKPEDIDEQCFSDSLYSKGIPDPDLLIRTSGEKRISNFLLWQNAYTEFYFTDKLWPDFSKKDLEEAIEEYRRRQRRFGGS